MCLKLITSLSVESSAIKVAVFVAGEAIVRTIAKGIQLDPGLADRQVVVMTPQSRRVGRALEPESRGILKTILIAHYKLGIVGLVAGILGFAILYGLGIETVTRSPGLAIAAIARFGQDVIKTL